MKIKNIICAFLVTVVLSGCLTTTKPMMMPLAIQTLQSREYKATKEVVFHSIISVFQDIGYTISNADIQTGLIYAESLSSSDSALKFWLGVTKITQTKVTAFVEKVGHKTRARLNFVEINRESSHLGQTDRHDTPLFNAQLYQNAFEKIDDAIFIRSQK